MYSCLDACILDCAVFQLARNGVYLAGFGLRIEVKSAEKMFTAKENLGKLVFLNPSVKFGSKSIWMRFSRFVYRFVVDVGI